MGLLLLRLAGGGSTDKVGDLEFVWQRLIRAGWNDSGSDNGSAEGSRRVGQMTRARNGGMSV